MKEFNIPENVSFQDLCLKAENNKFLFNREPLQKICLANGINTDYLNKGVEIGEAGLITLLYAYHLENGGCEDSVAELVKQYVGDIYGFPTNKYREFEYSEPGRPNENSKALLTAMADGNSFLRNISQNEYELIGRFFSIVLLIEYKFEKLLSKFCPKISKKTFGRKIDVYVDFLSVFELADDDELSFYQDIVNPLKELNSLRNKVAHNIKKIHIKYKDVPKIVEYIQENASHLFLSANLPECEDDGLRALGAIYIFGHKFSEVMAHLRVQIK